MKYISKEDYETKKVSEIVGFDHRLNEARFTYGRFYYLIREFAESEETVAFVDDFLGEISINLLQTILRSTISHSEYKEKIYVRKKSGYIFLTKEEVHGQPIFAVPKSYSFKRNEIKKKMKECGVKGYEFAKWLGITGSKLSSVIKKIDDAGFIELMQKIEEFAGSQNA